MLPMDSRGLVHRGRKEDQPRTSCLFPTNPAKCLDSRVRCTKKEYSRGSKTLQSFQNTNGQTKLVLQRGELYYPTSRFMKLGFCLYIPPGKSSATFLVCEQAVGRIKRDVRFLYSGPHQCEVWTNIYHSSR
jgi:hypothetical protein